MSSKDTKWGHYIGLTYKFVRTLLPTDLLDEDAAS